MCAARIRASFLHTFRQNSSRINGHGEGSVSLSYGSDEYGSVYSLKTLYEAILRIDVFNGLVIVVSKKKKEDAKQTNKGTRARVSKTTG